jgi:hypothetical protein
VDRRPSQHTERAVGTLDDLLLLPVVLFVDVPEQLLEDVLDRHDPHLLPELVHDDGDMDLPALELAQQQRRF